MKSKQARTEQNGVNKKDEASNLVEQKKNFLQELRNKKHLTKRQDKRRRHTGVAAHASHTDLETGNELAESGARQATLDRWVAGPLKHVDKWKPD